MTATPETFGRPVSTLLFGIWFRRHRTFEWAVVLADLAVGLLLGAVIGIAQTVTRFRLPAWYVSDDTGLTAWWPGGRRHVALPWAAITRVSRRPRRELLPAIGDVASADDRVIPVARSFPAYEALLDVVHRRAVNCRTFHVYRTGLELHYDAFLAALRTRAVHAVLFDPAPPPPTT